MATIKKILGVSTLLFASATLASPFTAANFDWLKNFTVSAAVGPNWTAANNPNLIVSPSEMDSIRVNNSATSALWKAGIGAHYLTEMLKNRRFFTDLIMEANVYGSSETLKGNVWQFQSPQFNNYSFSAPLSSIRFMIDAKPTLFTTHHFSFYPVVGVGVVWNLMSFQETATGASISPSTANQLASSRSNNFAYDVGAGIRYELTEHLSASLEYLYANLGKVSPSSNSKNNNGILSPPTFRIYTQSLLFGFNWKIG